MRQLDNLEPNPTEESPAETSPAGESVTAPRQKSLPRRLSNFKRFTFLGMDKLTQPELDDLERRGNLLNLVLIAVAAYIIFTVPVSLFLNLFGLYSVLSILLIAVGSAATFILNRLKMIKLAGYIFLSSVVVGLWLVSVEWISKNLMLVSFNYFTIAGVVVLAGLVISEIAPFVFTGVASILFITLFVLQINDTNMLFQIVAGGLGLQFIMALLSWGNARSIRSAIQRMAWQTTEVIKINNQLEDTLSFDIGVSNSISDLSVQLNRISQDQSNRAQNQAQSVAIVTSTLEELSATARQIADVAEGVFTATEQALRTAESGGQAVGLGIDSIATLTGQVESISKIANELGSQSRRISEIVELITELAEETNLLALNATIEAAGAGEYGRRFQVVASEVQTLANRSRAASRDVQTILGQIRNSINNTLVATDKGLDEARRMSEVASQAGEAIEQIIETVESTTFLARQIYLTTQQQRTATDQAVEMVRQVAGDSREGAIRARQLLDASQQLNQASANLRRIEETSLES